MKLGCVIKSYKIKYTRRGTLQWIIRKLLEILYGSSNVCETYEEYFPSKFDGSTLKLAKKA